MSILGKLKDKAVNIAGDTVAKSAINKKISDYGEITMLDIKGKTIAATVLLKGEKDTISVIIEDYEIIKSDASFVIKSVNADREWLDALLKNNIVGKRWPIPEKVAPYIDKFI